MGIKALWEARVLPRLLDRVCGSRAIRAERERWIPFASGEVLEVGIGSGTNLRLYHPGRVQRLVGIDPSEPLLAMTRARVASLAFPVELVTAPAETLPFDAGRFDTAVITYTLCSVSSPRDVLGEVRRVLRPGGKLVFLEHGAAPDASSRRWQGLITPVWRHLSGNCHLDRDVRRELEAARFGIEEIESHYAEEGPRWFTFTSGGVANSG